MANDCTLLNELKQCGPSPVQGRPERIYASIHSATRPVRPITTRRDFALLSVQAALALPACLEAQGGASSKRNFESSFDALLGRLSNAGSLELGLRRDQTDRVEENNALPQGQVFIRALPSTARISKRATSLIISSEVSGVSQYMQRFHKPTWPGGSSGVTIGIGYDLGFVNLREFRGDWADYLGAADFALLASCCGVHSEPARAVLQSVSRVDIPWPVANRQYEEQIQPRRIGETQSVLRNCELLSPDSLGALVSLVYNRGAAGFLVPATKDPAGRFREMRKIRDLMEAKSFSGIPLQLLSMRRLWEKIPGGEGLVLRRELEAQLFSLGLAT
jgi:GH24 family phage-related lysozyme (muramidase)